MFDTLRYLQHIKGDYKIGDIEYLEVSVNRHEEGPEQTAFMCTLSQVDATLWNIVYFQNNYKFIATIGIVKIIQ